MTHGKFGLPLLAEALVAFCLICPLDKEHNRGYSKLFAFWICFISASFKMVSPDFVEKQTIHLLEVDSGLLKFIFTLTKATV